MIVFLIFYTKNFSTMLSHRFIKFCSDHTVLLIMKKKQNIIILHCNRSKRKNIIKKYLILIVVCQVPESYCRLFKQLSYTIIETILTLLQNVKCFHRISLTNEGVLQICTRMRQKKKHLEFNSICQQ